MTEISQSELKLLYIEIIIVALAGVFMLLYNASPINQSFNVQDLSNKSAIKKGDQPWGTTLVDNTLGLPIGFTAIIIVASVFLIPMTIMNSLTLLRLAKDLATQWL